MRAQPVNLGGINAPSGGQGGGPGYIGYLPQTRVAYDETEAESLTTAVSGSLLDNDFAFSIPEPSLDPSD